MSIFNKIRFRINQRFGLIRLKHNTQSKSFYQFFAKDNYGQEVYVTRYHSGSFEISAKSPTFGMPICIHCKGELPQYKEHINRIFVKYDIVHGLLNFLAEAKIEKSINKED